MEWYENAMMAAEENHDPEYFDGREWDELENCEREELIDQQAMDTFTDAVDLASTLRKEGK